MIDELGKRLKEQYENRARYFLPRRTYSILRLDGKNFHNYTKNCNKPFDDDLISDIDNSICSIMQEIQGANFAYCQSDEISILLTDFENINTCAWFDGNIQKITSVSASLLTAEFNLRRNVRWGQSGDTDFVIVNKMNLAHFDSRIFTIPDRTEVMNYFIWRNQDCAKNSISMLAQTLFSHKELQNKNSKEKQEMIFQKSGQNWANLPENHKNGRLIIKTKDENNRGYWVSTPGWKFTLDKDKLLDMIPKIP